MSDLRSTESQDRQIRTRLALKTPESAAHTLSRLLRMRINKEIDGTMFRDMTYGMNVLLSYFKHMADMRIEERIEAIENALEARK